MYYITQMYAFVLFLIITMFSFFPSLRLFLAMLARGLDKCAQVLCRSSAGLSLIHARRLELPSVTNLQRDMTNH